MTENLTEEGTACLSPEALPRETRAHVTRNDAFPPIHITWIKSDDIEVAARRVRKAPKRQVAAVKRSMEQFGNRIPILVRGRNGRDRHEVIDGHVRLAAARLLGAGEVPCIVVDDLPDAEIRRLALSLNKIQETGEWDSAALRLEFGELIALEEDYDFPGFEIADVEALLAQEDDDAPDPADDPSGQLAKFGQVVTRPGDLWQLGEHRVLCGSARDKAAYDQLLEGRIADLV